MRSLLASGLALVAVLAFATISPALAQVSLAMEDRIDDISVKIGGQVQKFTVIRDAWNSRQWYVVPDRPRLAERVDSAGNRAPELIMLLIQSEDESKRTITEEALLQFAVSLAIPSAA